MKLGTPADLKIRISISRLTVRVRFEGTDAGEPAFSQYLDKIFEEIKGKIS